MIFGAILAGGSGTRMQNSALPKQFLMLGDYPILIRTLRIFLACPQIDHVLVGVPATWLDYTQTLLDTYCPHADVSLFAGGATRTDTLFAAADAARARFGTQSDDILITHDAVRPFITQQMLTDNIAAARECGACGTAVAAVDTILESNDGQWINAIPPRAQMYQMQTPQTFQIDALHRAYAALTPEQQHSLTDGCGIFSACGLPVRLVNGSVRNIKLTTPTDLAIAQAFLAQDCNIP